MKAPGIDEVIARLRTYVEHGADLGMLGDFVKRRDWMEIEKDAEDEG
ncbi:MAG TPA: hypothetical protein VMG58_04495 [Candidatus Sulfotelmatobacter sp.]|nr:hypothetical protein [Candidatus Sulfotelmatobacter sp.]